MVWNQYVFEANEGYDVYDSEEEEYNENNKLTIEDWEVEHSDVLWRMWHTINTLLYDARIEHTGKFCDFVALDPDPHSPNLLDPDPHPCRKDNIKSEEFCGKTMKKKNNLP